MRKKQFAALALALWLTVISVFMLFTERFDLGLFYVLGFIGFLVIVELMEPRSVKPGYLWYIRFLTVIGIVVFGMILAQKLLDLFGLEIVLA
jgi:membrane-bound ClpP family serine protease